jgi:hypothetical protein
VNRSTSDEDEAVLSEPMANVLRGLGLAGITSHDVLASSVRSKVVRVHVDGRTLVVKQTLGSDADARAKFANEVSALRFFNEVLPSGPALVPELLGVDAGARVLAMSDAGPGESLADALLSGDAESATVGLRSWAVTLGVLNGLSTRAADRFVELRSLWPDPFDSPTVSRLDAWIELLVGEFGPSTEARSEARALRSALSSAGPWTGVALRDACPGNERLASTGAVLFDFEVAQAQSVLLDAAHVLRPFPNCWCQARVPDAVHLDMQRAYFAELETAADRRVDWELLAACEAALAVRDVAQGLAGARASSARYEFAPAVASRRERVGGALGRLATIESFPGLAGLATSGLAALRAEWGPEGRGPPLYPAFRGPA